MSYQNLQYLSAEELVSQLEQDESHKKIVILDVRDPDEFSEGHIKGATNLPSTEWQDQSFVDNVLNGLVDTDSSNTNIVMHCAFSQKRGPTCAQILQNRISKMAVERGVDSAMFPTV